MKDVHKQRRVKYIKRVGRAFSSWNLEKKQKIIFSDKMNILVSLFDFVSHLFTEQ